MSALLRSHVLSVPFENLDVQFGTPLTTAVEAAFDKIVNRRRGGWCYEQNGVFGWALSEIGFDVTRVAAHVMRADRGPEAANNHLSLLVGIPDRQGLRYLVDVGFGGSLLQPLELAEQASVQAPFRVGLRRLEDGHWQFWENHGDGDFSFDFLAEPGDEDALAAKCVDLQRNPTSSFVLNLVAQRRAPDRHTTLRGRVLKVVTPTATRSDTLESESRFVAVLEDTFGLRVPGMAELWPRVVARHDEFMRERESGTDTG